MQVCSKYGKISKLDYLFHKSGPQKGKPRGYAFVEFATKEVTTLSIYFHPCHECSLRFVWLGQEAQRAMVTLHDKVLRGRKLVVSLASEQVQVPFPCSSQIFITDHRLMLTGSERDDDVGGTQTENWRSESIRTQPTDRNLSPQRSRSSSCVSSSSLLTRLWIVSLLTRGEAETGLRIERLQHWKRNLL